nr:LysR family transcriptional regulator [Photobacterium leiognathi]
MDIEALRSFLAFVETGSFTRVAKQSFRSQSAINLQSICNQYADEKARR